MLKVKDNLFPPTGDICFLPKLSTNFEENVYIDIDSIVLVR